MRRCDPLSCILSCTLGLNCSEAEVYGTLLRLRSADVDEIAKKVEKDKTTVYRALQNLVDKGLAVREYRIMRSGGYKYIYRPVPIKNFKEIVTRRVNEILNVLFAEVEESFLR